VVNLQGFDKTTAAAQPASVTQAERNNSLTSSFSVSVADKHSVPCAPDPVQLYPLCAASLKSSESLTYDFSNTWRYSKGLGTLLLCSRVKACVSV